MIPHFVRILFFVVALVRPITAPAESPMFRYAVQSEPQSLDPTESIGMDVQHLFGNIFRGLFRIDDQGALIHEGAKICRWINPLRLDCELKNLKFSDGTDITSKDYVTSFRHFLRPESKTGEIDLLWNLKNARLFHEGKSTELGISAPKARRLVFEFDHEDPEFEYKLTSPLLVPWKVKPSLENITSLPVNGPYKFKLWEKNKRILLEPNVFYSGGHPHRPSLEVRFVPDEVTLMSMFDADRLDFIRRLPTLSIGKYKNHPGFIARPLSRFDYLGFGPQLQDFPEYRKALTESAAYEEFRTLFDSLGRPGCPSFPESYMDRRRCYDFKGKPTYEFKKPTQKVRLLINQTAGDDLRRGAEWFQNQWQARLGVPVEIDSIEGKVLTAEIKNNPPPIFWRSLSLTRPTCLAALELFQSRSENNFIRLQDNELDRLILKLAHAKSKAQKKLACGRALDRLLGLHRLIPLGRFQFFMVLSSRFKGLHINELNHLDLAQLHLQ